MRDMFGLMASQFVLKAMYEIIHIPIILPLFKYVKKE